MRELVQHCQDRLTNYVDGPAPLSFVARLAERFDGVQVSFLKTVYACLLGRPADDAIAEHLAHGLLAQTHSPAALLVPALQGVSKPRSAAALKDKGLKRLRRTRPAMMKPC